MKLKKNPKVDLNRWSNTFFLFGLAAMLLIAWQGLEWEMSSSDSLGQEVKLLGDDLEMDIPITQQLNQPPPPPPPPAAVIPEVINVVEDSETVEETVFESTETDQNLEIVAIESIEEVEEEEEIAPVPFAVIEDVPIYPGCEVFTSNDERKACLAEHVMKYVQQGFNTELASELGLEGKQRISVQFKIDKKGNVVDVRARAPHPRLEEEAIKLVGSLPQMIPGKQRGKPVGVLYALPILFKVEHQ